MVGPVLSSNCAKRLLRLVESACSDVRIDQVLAVRARARLLTIHAQRGLHRDLNAFDYTELGEYLLYVAFSHGALAPVGFPNEFVGDGINRQLADCLTLGIKQRYRLDRGSVDVAGAAVNCLVGRVIDSLEDYDIVSAVILVIVGQIFISLGYDGHSRLIGFPTHIVVPNIVHILAHETGYRSVLVGQLPDRLDLKRKFLTLHFECQDTLGGD